MKQNNEILNEIVTNYWGSSNKIIKSTEVPAGVDYKKNDDYIYIYIMDKTDKRSVRDTDYYFSYQMLVTRCNGKWLAYYGNTGGNFLKFELICGMKCINKAFEVANQGIDKKNVSAYLLGQNQNLLKTKTLLIPEEITRLTTEEIAEVYPYQFKLLPIKQIKEIVEAKKPNYIFYWPQHEINSCGTGFHHSIYSCEYFSLIVLNRSAGVTAGTFGGNSSTFNEVFGGIGSTTKLDKILRKKTLRKFSKEVQQ